MVPCKSTAKEVSFEWSHHRISSTDSKVRTTWSERVTQKRVHIVNLKGDHLQDLSLSAELLIASTVVET